MLLDALRLKHLACYKSMAVIRLGASACCKQLVSSAAASAICIQLSIMECPSHNAFFFLLTIHGSGLNRRCSIVTSSFHMPRSRAIFERCFSLAGETLWGTRAYFDLDYHAVHDEGAFPEDVLAARLQREAQSLEVCSYPSPPQHVLTSTRIWSGRICWSHLLILDVQPQ